MFNDGQLISVSDKTMTPLFQYELVNQPFGDPVLYVRLMGEKKALLFDLGEINTMRAGKLFKVTDVFVTHTHMDHFIGFDHLVRLNLGRDKVLRIHGPEGIIRNVRARLRGYTWNLVDNYPFVIEAHEICATVKRIVRFPCRLRFKAVPAETVPFDGTVDAQPHYTVKALRIDHKITSLAYALEERFHINIDKERLGKLGLPVGSWLRSLKELIWTGQPDDTPVHIPADRDPGSGETEMPLGRLKKEIVRINRGQKIVYVSDCRGTARNFAKIIPFAAGADILFCEAAFLDRDADKARAKGHLTAKHAGAIAREAGAHQLKIFHFSPRYEHCPGLLFQEALHEFSGQVLPGRETSSSDARSAS